MKARFLFLLAGAFVLLTNSAALHALSLSQTESFNFANPTTVTFTVINSGEPPATVTTNSPQTPTQDLTFDKFNGALGTLTQVTITFTTAFGATATVTVPNNGVDQTIDFFADATLDHMLSGSLITAAAAPQQQFSASCQAAQGGNCASGPVLNNGTFNNASGVATAPIGSFIGVDDFTLTASLSSALAPRTFPDNETGDFADNTTFSGTLDHTWSGDVTVRYDYNPFSTAVPEPLSLYLLLAGLGGIALSRRRR
jgi:hypothetical protein